LRIDYQVESKTKKVKQTDPNGQAEVSRAAQINMAGYDSLGACIMAGFGVALDYSVINELINSIYGSDVEGNYLQEIGKITLRFEHEFNRRAGFSSQDDRLPEWMSYEPLPPHNTVFDGFYNGRQEFIIPPRSIR